MANIDNLAPIQAKGKTAKGKSKKQAIEEAEAEADSESVSEEYADDMSPETVDIPSDDTDGGNDNAPSTAATENLDDLMLDIKV